MTSPWHDHAWAAEYLGLCPRHLRRLMRDAEKSTVVPAYVNVGSGRNARYRWDDAAHGRDRGRDT